MPPPTDVEAAPPKELSTEITNSIVLLWSRYCGIKPSAETSISRSNRIVCVLEGAVSAFDAGLAASERDAEGAERPLTALTCRRDAIAGIERLTKRRVAAFISDHDAKTDVATEIFLLEIPRRTY